MDNNDLNIQASDEPIELTDPKDFSLELEDICKREYPDVVVESYDYTQAYKKQKAENGNLSFSLITGTTGEIEPYIKPMGEYGGIFRASLLINAYLEKIPDPDNREDYYLVYPSFNKETQALEKLLLLKYPDEIFIPILLDQDITENMFKYLPSEEAMEIIRKIRSHFPRRW